MKSASKILIAYDGSSHADAIWADLAHAGLESNVQARVLTVADPWMPPLESLSVAADVVIGTGALSHQVHNNEAARNAEETAGKGAKQLRKKFPDWKITSVATLNSPANGILEEAGKWKPGLIILGSKGHTLLERVLMGSVSHKVLTHAACNVRIARPASGRASGKVPRILLAVDGSRHSDAVVECVAGRSWPRGAEFRLIVVLDQRLSLMQENQAEALMKGRLRGMRFEGGLSEKILERAALILGERGLKVTSVVREGDPRREIAREVKRFKATCLFLGGKGLSGLERFLIGSTSAALAEIAECAVEIVRR